MKLFSFLIVFLVLSSCNQNKKLEEDLGAKVTADQYENAVIAAWGNDDILTIKKDDYAYIEKSISINYGPMQKSFGKAMTITQIESDAEVVRHHLVIQSEEIQNGSQSKLSSRERVLAVKKTTSQSQSVAQANAKPGAKTAADDSVGQLNVEDEIQTTPFEGFLDALNLCRYKTVECFSLKVVDFTEAVPIEIKDQGCRFFPDCKWSGKQVSFVIRVSYTDEATGEAKTQNNIISYKIIPNMPYLFKMAEYCFEGLSEYQGQKFPVKICTQVKDTIKGQ